jgi:hypothetical protein
MLECLSEAHGLALCRHNDRASAAARHDRTERPRLQALVGLLVFLWFREQALDFVGNWGLHALES